MGIRKVKDSLFYYFIEKNPHILRRYQLYKWGHGDKKENKLKSWIYIATLNFTYRILRIQNEDKTSDNLLNSKGHIAHRKNKAKLPYLEGAESASYKRPQVQHFAKNLLQYDVISFDVFDTLILRPFAQPHDLFMILGEKLNIINFMTIRRRAEADARKIAVTTKGNHEVTLNDIYELIEYRTGVNREYGVQLELETELEFCRANPYMMEVFKILKANNKKIIANSDMYVTRPMLIRLLEKCGYTGFFDVLVSSEHNGSKRDKNLYKILKTKINKEDKIVHIGDNYTSDIVSANESGIESRYYKNVHEIGNQYRADGMSELIGSTYSGIVNVHLHNGLKQYSPQYEYGFIYGGLYVLGYCQWIYDYAKKNNIDKVIFLSRDGDLYQKVFNYLFSDMDNEYMYWSRIANTKYTIENNREDFLTRMVHQKALNVLTTSLKGLLESLGLDELISLLENYGLNSSDIIHTGNEKIIEKFFIENWGEVVRILTKDLDIVENYIRGIVQDAKNVAIVDVGWIGSGGAGIKYLIEDKFNMECKVHSLVAASRHWSHHANLHQLMNGELQAYLFSRMHNRAHYDVHSNTNKNTNNMYFELFTQANYPSFAGFERTDEGYKFLFDVPEVENYEIINEIQSGIMDFVKEYKGTFGKYEYLLNISGYDAYLPYRMIIRDLKFIRTYFGEFQFSRGVIGDTENQIVETLEEIMSSVKL